MIFPESHRLGDVSRSKRISSQSAIRLTLGSTYLKAAMIESSDNRLKSQIPPHVETSHFKLPIVSEITPPSIIAERNGAGQPDSR